VFSFPPDVEFPCPHVAAINRELPQIEQPIIANRSFRVEVVRLADDDKGLRPWPTRAPVKTTDAALASDGTRIRMTWMRSARSFDSFVGLCAAAKRSNRDFFGKGDQGCGDAVASVVLSLSGRFLSDPTDVRLAEFRASWFELALAGELPSARGPLQPAVVATQPAVCPRHRPPIRRHRSLLAHSPMQLRDGHAIG
jgi:hypothetical protein